MFKLNILFGEDAVKALEYDGIDGVIKAYNEDNITWELVSKEFKTRDEMNAYISGLNDCLGWGDFGCINDIEVERLKEV